MGTFFLKDGDENRTFHRVVLKIDDGIIVANGNGNNKRNCETIPLEENEGDIQQNK